jgi:two-component system sensor histidine kinase AlgZ
MKDTMERLSNKSDNAMSRGVYPPSFCRWRLLLVVVAMTQLSVLLMGVGRLPDLSLLWLGAATMYAQALALMTALGVCISRAWLGRLSARGAWLGSWIMAVLVALGFSYSAGIVGTVLGAGPGRQDFAIFVWQSVLAVALVGAALLRYLFIRAQWRTQVLAQSEARVQALQARIRPHFLFNSLNTIASLIPEEPVSAECAIEDLARRYLQMEQRRLGERLRVEWRVSELPEGASVLPLTLQPLLENAVTHGIQPRTDGGEVRVYGRAEKENIVITISNPLGLRAPGNRGHGMALANIRERLELAFGPNASLITHQNDEQFFAVLSLPYVENTRS